ncbi:MAG: hypothetical protein M1835_001272, partial [Candelina submexicana]
ELSIQESNPECKGLVNDTTELYIISKDVKKLISNLNIASRNLTKTQEALARLDYALAPKTLPPSFSAPSACSVFQDGLRQQLIDTLQYLCALMDK